jgi:protein-arginine kinase activator protein McsA
MCSVKGKVRVPSRYSKCPKCGERFVDIGKKGFVCANCLTVPERFLVDIHLGDKRPRIGVDKQGRPLDTYERAYDLLAHIKYEIDNHIFDPAKYIKSEQKEFYVSTQLERYCQRSD